MSWLCSHGSPPRSFSLSCSRLTRLRGCRTRHWKVDLNPLLQDLGLAIHPPLLYLGYVGFSISFFFAIAALIEGRIDAAWARWVRPWTLLAWMFLTIGIAMGSYGLLRAGLGRLVVLGSGGECLLHALACRHGAVAFRAMEKRNALKVWTLLLAILAFSLSLLGTFLVRSGVLTSVHTFATDPLRGVFILVILVVFIGGAFGLFAWRAPMLKQGACSRRYRAKARWFLIPFSSPPPVRRFSSGRSIRWHWRR